MTQAHGRRRAAVVAICISLTGCGLQRDIADNPDLGRSSLTVAPSIAGTALDGAAFTVPIRGGHPIVLDVWASWCGPCRKQQPEVDTLAMEFAPRGVIFVGIDLRDDDASGRAYAKEFTVPYPSLSDRDGALAAQLDVPAPPTTLVIDADGRIVKRVLGGITAADLRPLLAQLALGTVSTSAQAR